MIYSQLYVVTASVKVWDSGHGAGVCVIVVAVPARDISSQYTDKLCRGRLANGSFSYWMTARTPARDKDQKCFTLWWMLKWTSLLEFHTRSLSYFEPKVNFECNSEMPTTNNRTKYWSKIVNFDKLSCCMLFGVGFLCPLLGSGMR